MEQPSITRNFIFNILLTLSTYLAQLIVYPYVSRVLGVDMMGVIGFVNKTIDFFLIFSSLGITTIGIREIASVKNNTNKLNRAFSCLITFSIITTFITSIIYLIVVLWINKFNIYSHLFLIGLSKLVFSAFLIEWFYQGLESFRYITVRSVLVKIIYVISVFSFVKEKEDYIIFFLLTTIVVVLNSAVNWWSSRHYVRLSLNFRDLHLYTRQLFTYGFYQLLNSTFSTFNYILLGILCVEKEVGYYYTAENFYFILLALISAFTRVMLPRMSYLLSEGNIYVFNSLIGKSLDTVLMVCLPISIYGVFFADGIIEIFSGPGYEGAVFPMQIMMALVVINAVNQILITQVAVPLKLDRQILIGTCIASFISLPANYFLIKSYGALGCSIVLVISVIVANIYPIIYLLENCNISIPVKILRRQLFYAVPYIFISIVIYEIGRTQTALTFVAALLFILYFLILPGRKIATTFLQRFMKGNI